MPQPDFSQLMQLIRSPAGQQLVQLLQTANANTMQTAASQAATGDYLRAKNTLAPLLDSPEVRRLLQQLGGTP